MPNQHTGTWKTDAEILEAYREHGGVVPAAKALGIDESIVRRRVRKLQADGPKIFESTNLDKANRIVQLLEDAKIPIDSIGGIDKVKISSYGTPMKLIERDPSTGKIVNETPYVQAAHSTSFVFSPTWEIGPAWPVVQPAKPAVVKYSPPTVIVPKGLRTEIVLPDSQFGFLRRVDTGEMLPMHDEAAHDVAAQIVGAVQPHGLTWIGDLLDFSEMSRYLQVEEFFRTTQPAIDAAYLWMARCLAVSPKTKKKRLVPGNHERRLSEYVQKNARAAFRLRPAMTTPEWPDNSLPRLLRFEELGVEYMGEWPGGEAWLVQDGPNPLVVMHDPKARGMVYASIIAGHTHKHSETTFAIRAPHGGHLTFTHYEIGCLCSLERNPDKLSLQRTRVPSDRGSVSGWSQGVAVVEILEATGQHQLTFVPIKNGQALFRGQIFSAPAEPPEPPTIARRAA